ncbi:hypothetical protein FQ087_05330 [Sporosarcina sp. ANT_H38]|uniref:hypothetical protein n=1 Tax=Sporosarcina sp. ANT_H38 TaxID=2597358 RepID=UPI0011F2948E|nr:hypothetical protein [Sporosarcina sp. ANT_H38]KAA0965708.1 hypothetical protein FQ087_05330 [Sporosarcina sp. ANT_H38]
MDFNGYVVSYEVETRKKQVDAIADRNRKCGKPAISNNNQTAKKSLRFNLFTQKIRIDCCNCDF